MGKKSTDWGDVITTLIAAIAVFALNGAVNQFLLNFVGALWQLPHHFGYWEVLAYIFIANSFFASNKSVQTQPSA